MTKEEIQVQLDTLKFIYDDLQDEIDRFDRGWGNSLSGDIYNFQCKYHNKIHYAKQELAKAKSIQDLQREAFEAGRLCYSEAEDWIYKTVEDYLKTLEDDK